MFLPFQVRKANLLTAALCYLYRRQRLHLGVESLAAYNPKYLPLLQLYYGANA
jgi:hypothetical protein